MTKWKFAILFAVGLCITVYVGTTAVLIRNKNVRIEELTAENIDLKAKVKKLEEMPVINQSVTFNLTNKAVFGRVTAGDFIAASEQVQSVTRKALADYCDSIKKIEYEYQANQTEQRQSKAD